MPAEYVALRDDYLRRGFSKQDAERHAAMIYNAHRSKGATPMGPNYEQRAHEHGAHDLTKRA